MRGLTLDGVRTVTYRRDLPEPRIEQPSDALVRVEAAGLCGSDLHPYEGREPVRFGIIPGHEVVGRVAAVGRAVAGFGEEDRVVVPFTTSCGRCRYCRRGLSSRCVEGGLFGYGDPGDPDAPALPGGQAELVRVPLAGSTMVRLPEPVGTPEAVLLADNFPTGWHAAEQADPVAGEPLIVIGLGSVGLCAVAAARAMGADPVVAIDPLPDRRARATSLGANPLGPEEDSPAALSIVEAAGTMAAQELAVRLLRPGGTLSIISVPTHDRMPIHPVDAYDRNLTLRTGRAPVRSILDRLMEAIGSGFVSVPAGVVLTHPDTPLEHGAGMYRRFAAREPGLLKAAFAP